MGPGFAPVKNSYFKQVKWVFNVTNDVVFKTERRANIHTKNCVYLISCTKCGMKYVGETGLTIQVRFTSHRHNIVKQKNKDRHVVEHFIVHGWSSIQALVLEQNLRAQHRGDGRRETGFTDLVPSFPMD